MTVTINGTSGITTPGLNSTASNVLGDNVADTLNVGNGAIVTDASGNVGIGTSSPQNNLDISPASGGAYIRLKHGSLSDYWTISANSVGEIRFTNTNTERMRIDSSGNLLVGGRADLLNTLSGGTVIQGANNNLFVNRRDTTSSANHFVFRNPNGEVGIISTSGSSTTYATSSDYRLKENIQPMQGALAVVQQLRPVTYNWKADGSDGQGFIAHELQAVVPDCVTGEKDAVDAEGNPVYQGIDTSFLVATLAKAIQEQQAQIEALTTRLTAAEEQILNIGVTK